jgi:hypothetical protein
MPATAVAKAEPTIWAINLPARTLAHVNLDNISRILTYAKITAKASDEPW